MKDAVDSLPVERPIEPETFANRKLIRPSLTRNDHNHSGSLVAERRDRPERSAERNDRNDRATAMAAAAKHLHQNRPMQKTFIIKSKCRRERRW